MKNLLSQLTFHFHYFKYKKFYLLLSLDMLFIISLILINIIAESFATKVTSLGSLLFALFLVFIIVLSIYSFIKSYFYITLTKEKSFKKYSLKNIINNERPFQMILWKHGIVLLIVSIISFTLVLISSQLIKKAVLIQYVAITERIAMIIITTITYFIFIHFHNYDTENLFIALWKGIKSSFSNIGKLIYINITLILGVYLIYNLVSYIFRFIYLKLYSNILLLSSIFNRFDMIYLYLTLALLLVFNKLIAYNVQPKSLK
jgi:hypothetical protein